MGWYRREPGGIVLSVRLTPKAARDAVDGRAALSDGREIVVVRVRAVPEKGAANKALTDLLAVRFGVARSSVAVIGGGSGRLKQVRIVGSAEELAAVADGLPTKTG